MRLFLTPRRKLLASFLLMIPASAGVMLFLAPKTTLAANPATINFQGKMVNADGTNVTNGTYTVIFRLYDTAAPTTSGTCSSNASCWWEETNTNVTTTNGVFQVELGSVCAFTSACNSSHSGIDWSTNNALYLTMNFNGDSAGFMSPTIHLTSVPYAFNADRLGGLAASNFVQLQASSPGTQQTGNLNISGSAIFGTAVQTPLLQTAAAVDLQIKPSTGIVKINTASVDNELRVFENNATPTNYTSIKHGNISTSSGNLTVAAAGTTTIGNGTGAITINAGSGAAVNITGHAASVWQTDAGSLTIQGGTTLNLFSTTSSAASFDSGSTGDVNIGTGSNAKTVNIGNTTGATAVNINSGTGAVAIGTGAQARTINLGTGAAVQTITVGSQNSTSSLVLQGGSNNISLLTIGNIVIGTSDTTGTLLVLDTKTDAGDPTGVNGGLYYNSNAGRLRCYEGSVWKNCVSSPYNASTVDQAIGASTTAYLTGSSIVIPASEMQVGTQFVWRISLSKTAASTAAFTFNVRVGTNGTTADTSRLAFTTGAQTAAADTGTIDIIATVRSVGASSTMAGNLRMTHNLATTGLLTIAANSINNTSGTFDNTVNDLIVGVSLTTGASHNVTIQQVQANTYNL